MAISAPYEDGTGVIYIYKGSSKGPIFNERITPRSFTITNVKGFGLGISNGNDIDKNGHNGNYCVKQRGQITILIILQMWLLEHINLDKYSF